MSDNTDKASEKGISTGDVHGTGIVIGHHSSASVVQSLSPEQQHVAALFEEFMKLLAHHEGAVPDAADVRASALAATHETQQPSPRWSLVRTLTKDIQASVAGVSTLAALVTNIQTILVHLPR
jgi:hypothetical protein